MTDNLKVCKTCNGTGYTDYVGGKECPDCFDQTSCPLCGGYLDLTEPDSDHEVGFWFCPVCYKWEECRD